MKYILCSKCFEDYGLSKMAERIGEKALTVCPNCGCQDGIKLSDEKLDELCSAYFVEGSYHKMPFGGSPVFIINKTKDEVCVDSFNIHIQRDMKLIWKKTHQTPVLYGPPMWRVGISEWIDRLTSKNYQIRRNTIDKLISRCNIKEITEENELYRIRINVDSPTKDLSFDAPDTQKYTEGRFNIKNDVVFYASFDVDTCIHECRISMEDVIYVATLKPCKKLCLLDLTDITEDESEEVPFEYLPMIVNQILYAGKQSYVITRLLSKAAQEKGFDGIMYPSYFNNVRASIYSNVVLFGQVIRRGIVRVKSIDRIQLRQVDYKYEFGPSFIL